MPSPERDRNGTNTSRNVVEQGAQLGLELLRFETDLEIEALTEEARVLLRDVADGSEGQCLLRVNYFVTRDVFDTVGRESDLYIPRWHSPSQRLDEEEQAVQSVAFGAVQALASTLRPTPSSDGPKMHNPVRQQVRLRQVFHQPVVISECTGVDENAVGVLDREPSARKNPDRPGSSVVHCRSHRFLELLGNEGEPRGRRVQAAPRTDRSACFQAGTKS